MKKYRLTLEAGRPCCKDSIAKIKRLVPGLLIGVVLGGGLLTASDSSHKTATNQAKQLLNAAREKERAGDLKGSLDSCLKSLALVESKDAEGELKKLRKEAIAQAQSHFDRARAEYGSGDYAKAIQSLLAAEELVGGSQAIALNLAITNYHLKQMAEASAWLNVAVQLSSTKDRAAMAALQSFVIAPGIASPNEKTTIQVWNSNLDKAQLQLREGSTNSSAACDELFKWQRNENLAPTVFYNLAECAQFEGKFGAAVSYLEEYLRRSPDAVDRPAAARQMDFWRRLAATEGPKRMMSGGP
jgi:tetratricopeptide (TPR) repeat protein